MGQVIDFAAYRKESPPASTETPVLPYIDYSGSRLDVVGTYHVHVFIDRVEFGQNVYVLEAYDSLCPYHIECTDKGQLKGLVDARRCAAIARKLMLRVRNSTGLPPCEILGLHPSEIMF